MQHLVLAQPHEELDGHCWRTKWRPTIGLPICEKISPIEFLVPELWLAALLCKQVEIYQWYSVSNCYNFWTTGSWASNRYFLDSPWWALSISGIFGMIPVSLGSGILASSLKLTIWKLPKIKKTKITKNQVFEKIQTFLPRFVQVFENLAEK